MTTLEVFPITARIVHKPLYNNQALATFSVWYSVNEAKLGEYWLALDAAEQARYEDDFREFAMTQHDVEGELQAAAALTTYGDAQEQSAYAAGDFGSDR